MINRSAGTIVTVGSIPYIVGGGYQGNTNELDKTVMEMAEILHELYGKDVEIRFNSDGNSGGAWLKNSLKGFDGNCQVGMCADLQAIQPEGMSDDEFFKQWRTLPKELYIATNLKPSILPTSFVCNSETYDYRYHKTIAEAVRFLKDNVITEKILK